MKHCQCLIIRDFVYHSYKMAVTTSAAQHLLSVVKRLHCTCSLHSLPSPQLSKCLINHSYCYAVHVTYNLLPR